MIIRVRNRTTRDRTARRAARTVVALGRGDRSRRPALLFCPARDERPPGAPVRDFRRHHHRAGGAAGPYGGERPARHDPAGVDRYAHAGQGALRVRERHGVDDFHRVSVFARGDADRVRHARGVPVHRALRADALASGLFPGGGGPGAGAVHPVGYGTRGRRDLSDYALRGRRLRVGTGADGGQDRVVFDAGVVPHHVRRVGDVPYRDGGEPADRGVRAQDRARGIDLGAVARGIDCAGITDARDCCYGWFGPGSSTRKKRAPWRGRSWPVEVPWTGRRSGW